MRIGNGYDVHRLVEGRKLILGGVEIPFHMGLLGHSDADVLVHAIIDALLGATCKGDIGRLFPDSDQNYKDINSMKLLEEVRRILTEEGYRVINIDCIIVAQKPKLMTYNDVMKNNIANCLGIDCCCVNVKAKTEEGLGFTGEGLGISAYAVCLIE